MKGTHKNTLEIYKRGGAVKASDWTTGRTPRFIKRRPTPQFCREVTTSEVEGLPAPARRSALLVLKKSPKARKLIVLVDQEGFETMLAKEFARELERLAV
jgi:hypothetical protein